MNDIIAQALNLANFPAMLEPSGIVREDNKRPDGMTNVPWSHGRHLVWDFTCPDTLAPSHLRSTAAEAAKEAEERKVSKYRSIAAYNTFIPVAVETLGPMGPEAKSFLLDLGRRLRQHTGELRSTSYLIQRISMAIHLLPHTADLNGDPGQGNGENGPAAEREGGGWEGRGGGERGVRGEGRGEGGEGRGEGGGGRGERGERRGEGGGGGEREDTALGRGRFTVLFGCRV